MATNNLIALTALASYSGLQVVVPFVNDSQFFGYKMSSDDTHHWHCTVLQSERI